MEHDASDRSSSCDAESSSSATVSVCDETEEPIELPANILAYVPGISGAKRCGGVASTVMDALWTGMRGADRGVSQPSPPLRCDWSATRRPFPRCGRWRGGGGGPVFGPRPSWRGRPPQRPFFGRRAGPPRFNPRGRNDAAFFGWQPSFNRGRAHHFYTTPYFDRDSPHQHGRRRPPLLPLPFLDDTAPQDADSSMTTSVSPCRPTTKSVLARQGAIEGDTDDAASASSEVVSLTEETAMSTASKTATTVVLTGTVVSGAAVTETSSVAARDDGARGQQPLTNWIRSVESCLNDAPVLTPASKDENAGDEPSLDLPTSAEVVDPCGGAEQRDREARPATTGEGVTDADCKMGQSPGSELTAAPLESCLNDASGLTPTPINCEDAGIEPSRDLPASAAVDDPCGSAEQQDPATRGEITDADYELGLTPGSAPTAVPVSFMCENGSTTAPCAAGSVSDNASVSLDPADSTPAPSTDSGESGKECSCVRSPSTVEDQSGGIGQVSNDYLLTAPTTNSVSLRHDTSASAENATVRDNAASHTDPFDSTAAPPQGSGGTRNEWSPVRSPTAHRGSVHGQALSDCPAVDNDDQCRGVTEEADDRMSLEMGCYEDAPDSQRPVVDDGLEYVLIASESGTADDDDVYVVCESRTLCAIQKM
ncbi:hypothetical protein HPB52_005936 [Rhipicephalus sanguineus]|uniref:Uncharacterized protein n=1 Tax=Rhipicephalus sanguineus TaxID=34632 RepID=A0A9D4QA03_RHISA|nr:hypothetical protein HPB52_005936 [Rhipicephalus sanguineus]